MLLILHRFDTELVGLVQCYHFQHLPFGFVSTVHHFQSFMRPILCSCQSLLKLNCPYSTTKHILRKAIKPQLFGAFLAYFRLLISFGNIRFIFLFLIRF